MNSKKFALIVCFLLVGCANVRDDFSDYAELETRKSVHLLKNHDGNTVDFYLYLHAKNPNGNTYPGMLALNIPALPSSHIYNTDVNRRIIGDQNDVTIKLDFRTNRKLGEEAYYTVKNIPSHDSINNKTNNIIEANETTGFSTFQWHLSNRKSYVLGIFGSIDFRNKNKSGTRAEMPNTPQTISVSILLHIHFIDAVTGIVHKRESPWNGSYFLSDFYVIHKTKPIDVNE